LDFARLRHGGPFIYLVEFSKRTARIAATEAINLLSDLNTIGSKFSKINKSVVKIRN
jgi:hypothetical protein